MRRTGRTPIDDDAEKTENMPLEASIPLPIMGNQHRDNVTEKHTGPVIL